jgi:hypothetical protein
MRGMIVGAAFAVGLAACASQPSGGGDVRMNQIQALGTHNSYKQAIPPVELAAIAAKNATLAPTIDYAHRPIAEQLDKGARQIELDPYDDPHGGAFLHPKGPDWMKAEGASAVPYDLSVMSKPGVKVFHITDIDYRSSCLLFVDCLQQVKAWSDAHRDHTPILIMINPKHTALSWPGSTPVRVFGAEAFERMEAEILSVFPKDRIVTPDEVRGSAATLRAGAMAGGWPTLAKARGRVIFAIDDSVARWTPYAEGHASLKGRLAFVNASGAPDAPEAAYFTMNEPDDDLALIQERVKQGFLVRTRADADTREARSGETARRDAALASGAQYISTDYLWPDARFGTGFEVSLPGGGEARCNPVNAAESCRLSTTSAD